MPRSRFNFAIGGKFQKLPQATCLLSSAGNPWSGLLTEYQHSEPFSVPSTFKASKPFLALIARGEPNTAWRAGGREHAQRWEPGVVVLLDRDYVLENLVFTAPHDAILIELDNAKLNHWMGDELRGMPHLKPHVITRDSVISNLARNMYEEVRAGCRAGRLFGESLSLAMMSYVWSRYADERRPVRRAPNGLSDAKLRRLQDFIESNLSSDLKLADLAGLLDLSPRHLCRSFKQATGLSPHQYVLQTRIEKAKALLARGKISVAEVALSLGFSSQSHFTDTFRKQTGVSPRRFSSHC